jgi:putative transposase
MNGNGRWIDNVFSEWLWRSVKYEEVYFGELPSMTRMAA